MTASLRTTLLPIVRHCFTLPASPENEQIEVELRVPLDGSEFYALFTMLSMESSDVVTSLGATKQDDAIFSDAEQPINTTSKHRRDRSRATSASRTRTVHTPDAERLPLFTVEKRRMLQNCPMVPLSNDLTIRIDVQREIFTPPIAHRPELFEYWRCKDRRSFVLTQAPLWQIDLTRIVEYRLDERDADARVKYELEFELLQAALHSARTSTAEETVEQLERVIKFVLGI